ncbi:MAG: SpoIIE family protein phosphatase [Acidobacteria bacterium]|nr:SpoIIE family protein phosphatase [Acidobacteriota bacterium]
MIERLVARMKAWGPGVLWPWALLLLGELAGWGFQSSWMRLFIWFGLAVLLWRGLRWSWQKLVFKVSRRVWAIIVLLTLVPVLALHVFFLSLGYFTLGGQVSRSVQGNLSSLRAALAKASADPDDDAALQQLHLLGDAWISRTDQLPKGIKPGFADIVRDISPATGKPAVLLRAVTQDGSRYRLLTLPVSGLTDQSASLWGGRTDFRLAWESEEDLPGVKVDSGAPVKREGATVLAWSTGDEPVGGGLFHPFALPSTSLRATDWATDKPMVFTLTPRTSLRVLFAGYGFGEDDRGNVAFTNLLMMVGIAGLLLVMAVIQLLAMLLGVRLAWTLGGSVDDLHKGVGRLAKGDFAARVRPRSRDQVGVLARTFNDMAGQLEASFDEREKRMALEEELRIAREVQMRLLPDLAAMDLPATVEATILPAKEVAGDYYDLFPLADGRLAFLVADVSGKGTSAAFYAAEVKGMSAALDKAALGPAEVASRINTLWTQAHQRKVFLTLVYGVFNPSDGRFSLVRCGHPEPLLRRADGRVERLKPAGLGIGLSARQFGGALEVCEDQLAEGDALILFTDGLTEAMDAGGRLYGLDRLEALLEGPEDDLRVAILADVTAFAESAGLQDDLTLMILRR